MWSIDVASLCIGFCLGAIFTGILITIAKTPR